MEIAEEIREAVAEVEKPEKKKRRRAKKELSEKIGEAIKREMLRVLDTDKASADLKVQASRILLQIGR